MTSLATEHANKITFFELYKKLGHLSYNYIKLSMKTSPLVITETITDYTETVCKDCILNNIRPNSVPKKVYFAARY